LIEKGVKIQEPKGKLGVMIPGLERSTTFIAGIQAIIDKHTIPMVP